MKIEVYIEKTYAFIIIGLMIVIASMILGYAYNSNGLGGNPAVAGHSADEIDWSKKILSDINISGDISGEANKWGNCSWRYVGASKSHNLPDGSAIYCQNGEYLAGFDINSCNNNPPYDAPGQNGVACSPNDSPFVWKAYCCTI